MGPKRFVWRVMKQILNRRKILKTAAALGTAALFLGGCGGVTEEMLASREKGIALLESGDYEGAVREFEELTQNAKRVTDFELDVLKYRAEAEFGSEDYEAAAHTYRILNQVDRERAEYYYFGAAALAKAKDTEGAQEYLDAGRRLDEESAENRSSKKGSPEKSERAPGYAQAVMALGDAFSAVGADDRAEELYMELLDSGYGTTETYNCLMLAAMERGEYEAALELASGGQALSDGLAARELKFNEAVCYEYLGQFEKALSLFREYVSEFGNDEKAEHEIAFLVTR